MSASFLVGRGPCLADWDRPSEDRDPGRSIRVSRGADTRAMRSGPSDCSDEPSSRWPGLRGFVGVDFFWEPELDEATVLEINPRATTSFVGLSRLLPAGHLAAAWLAACGVPGFESDCWKILPKCVRRQRPRLLRCRRHDPAGDGRGGDFMSGQTDPGTARHSAGWRWTSGAPISRRPIVMVPTTTVPFEVWRRPAELGQAIANLAATFPPFDRAAVTMTAELCDCYPTKAEGVLAILDAAAQALR